MGKFNVVATGGTFDEIHAGHIALLSKAFETGNKVIIGVSSDRFATISKGKGIKHDFHERAEKLRKLILEKFGEVNFEIVELESEFGPAVTTGEVDALITSAETAGRGQQLNSIRKQNSLNPVKIIIIDLVKAEDGGLISSTRIRSGEIDNEGRLLYDK